MRLLPGLLAVAAAAAAVLIQRPLLEIRLEGGPLVFREALDPGERFLLTYVHSVEGRPVREVYSLSAGGALVVHEHAFQVFGAGLGQVPGEGREVGAPGGWTRVVALERRVGAFALRVGQPAVDHRVHVRGREARLSASYAGQRVWVGGRRVPLALWIANRRPHREGRPAPWEKTP